MNPIPLSVVDDVTEELFFLDSELEFEQMVNDLGEKQPFIFTYLMTIGEGDFNEEERELLLLLGVIVWRIMSTGKEPIPSVSEDTLDQVEQDNMPLLEKLAEDDAAFMNFLDELISTYNQQEVLGYVIDSVMSEEEEDSGVRDVNQGILIIFLKIVIDCLDK